MATINDAVSAAVTAGLEIQGRRAGASEAGMTADDTVWLARYKREAADAEGPPVATEKEICSLTGMPEYNDTDPASPWVAVRALGFPTPHMPTPTMNPTSRRYEFREVRWERRAVRQWLERFDTVLARVQPLQKRHKHFR